MHLTFRIFQFLFLLAGIIVFGCNGKKEKQSETSKIEAKIDSLISLMTIEEKVNMIHASSSFTNGGVERLGIPELVTSDGPHGVRHEHGRDWDKDDNVLDSGSYLPTGTALAATWNPELGYEFGKVLGSEANFRGKDIILGPGLNIIRTPLNGRNFEYMTEDPYLNSKMVIGYIHGVQDQGIAACAKHYIANNQEYERYRVNIEMSDRAFREIYLPGFKAAVQEGEALTVMGAYNKFRGQFCSHNDFLLNDILKEELGFEGFVMSDWEATHNTLEAINNGLDLEMGTDLGMRPNPDYGKFYLGDTVVTLVKNGAVAESIIDEKVRRILRVMFAINKFGERVKGEYNTPEHQQTAFEIASEAVTLLKNESVLPLKKDGIKTLVVIGANATRKHAGAGGSSQVKAYYEVTPLEGIQNLVGESIEVNYSPGYVIERDGTSNPEMIKAAVANAKVSDQAILVVGWIRGYSDAWEENAFDAEDHDKPGIVLPFGQDELIKAVLKANPNTIVTIVGGGPVDMSAWVDDAKGIVQAWYGGMEGGNALAKVLFGDINPSGKLPMTFPKKLEDSPAHALGEYPGKDLTINYNEGIFVGYRYFDSYDVEPEFAFGHGLSYTTFEYSDIQVNATGNSATVSFKITNTGEMGGKEVAQVYVQDEEATLERPVKELKAFKKVSVSPGETVTINLELNEDAFKYFDDNKGEWVLEPGTFTIFVGSASNDIRLEKTIEL